MLNLEAPIGKVKPSLESQYFSQLTRTSSLMFGVNNNETKVAYIPKEEVVSPTSHFKRKNRDRQKKTFYWTKT